MFLCLFSTCIIIGTCLSGTCTYSWYVVYACLYGRLPVMLSMVHVHVPNNVWFVCQEYVYLRFVPYWYCKIRWVFMWIKVYFLFRIPPVILFNTALSISPVDLTRTPNTEYLNILNNALISVGSDTWRIVLHIGIHTSSTGVLGLSKMSSPWR